MLQCILGITVMVFITQLVNGFYITTAHYNSFFVKCEALIVTKSLRLKNALYTATRCMDVTLQ